MPDPKNTDACDGPPKTTCALLEEHIDRWMALHARLRRYESLIDAKEARISELEGLVSQLEERAKQKP